MIGGDSGDPSHSWHIHKSIVAHFSDVPTASVIVISDNGLRRQFSEGARFFWVLPSGNLT